MSYMGGVFIPLPQATLDALKWKLGDDIKVELVVKRDGTVDHIVVEKA